MNKIAVFGFGISLLALACVNYSFDEVSKPIKLKNIKVDSISTFIPGNYSGLFSSIELHSKGNKDWFLMNYCYEDSVKLVDFNNFKMLSYDRNFDETSCTNEGTFNFSSDRLISVNHDKEKIYISEKNILIDSIDLNEIGLLKKEDIWVDEYLPYCTQKINLDTDVVFIRVLPYMEKIKYKRTDAQPFLLIFNTRTHEYELIKFYNKRINTNGRKYAYLDFYHLLVSMNEVIVSYPSDAELDVFSIKTKSWKKVNVPSKFDKGFIFYDKKGKENTKDTKMTHQDINHKYHSLMYNQYTKKYYRIFAKALDRYDDKGFVSSQDEREYVLMVLDSNFTLLEEIELPNIVSFYALLPIKNGVLVNIASMNEDAEIKGVKGKKFHFLRIQHD